MKACKGQADGYKGLAEAFKVLEAWLRPSNGYAGLAETFEDVAEAWL